MFLQCLGSPLHHGVQGGSSTRTCLSRSSPQSTSEMPLPGLHATSRARGWPLISSSLTWIRKGWRDVLRVSYQKGPSRRNRRNSFRQREYTASPPEEGRPSHSRPCLVARERPHSRPLLGGSSLPGLTIMACCTRVLLCSHMFF